MQPNNHFIDQLKKHKNIENGICGINCTTKKLEKYYTHDKKKY